MASYRDAFDLYFRPGLGQFRLADLRDHHFRDLYALLGSGRKVISQTLGHAMDALAMDVYTEVADEAAAAIAAFIPERRDRPQNRTTWCEFAALS